MLELAEEDRAAWLANLGPQQSQVKTLFEELLAQRGEIKTDSFLDSLPKFDRFDHPQTGDGATAKAPALSAGAAVGPYVLICELGVGGMGAVWLAARADGTLKRTIALKLPHPGPFQQQLAERFSRERDILAALTHPHIARLYDAGSSESGQPYLALEYVEGMPLNEYCASKRLDVNARLDLFLQVLSAVQYAHTTLVLHRDLKPSNILVTPQGSVQLLDFGIAKFMSGNETHETELTQIGGRALTPDYASPEQILGLPLSTGSDVYSLGVILYELLSGARPYKLKRGTRGELEDAILAVDATRPSVTLRKRLSSPDAVATKSVRELEGDLDVICLKALKKKTEDRFPTVAAFAEEIARYRQGRPIRTRSDSNFYRTKKFVARHRVVVGLGAFAAMALIVGTIAATMQARRASAEAEVARQQSARAGAVERFLSGLFNANAVDQPDPQAAQRLTARELLDRGAARIDKELVNFPDAKADVLQTLSKMYGDLGEWDRAIEFDRDRLALVAKLHGRRSLRYVEALSLSAFRLNGARRFDAEVLKQTAEGKQILTELQQDKSVEYGALLRMEATVLRQTDLDAAVESARRAVEIMQPLNDQSRDFAKRLGSAWGDLGMTYVARGNYLQANDALARAYKLHADLHGGEFLDSAFIEALWGTVDAVRGEFDDAERRLRSGADKVRRAVGANQPASVYTDTVLGVFLHNTGRGEEGRKLVDEARQRIAQKLGALHPRTVDAQVSYAELLIADGRYDEAIALVTPLINDETPHRAGAEIAWASALLHGRDFASAAAPLKSAIDALEARKARNGRRWTEAMLSRGTLNLLRDDLASAKSDFNVVAAAVAEAGMGPQFVVRVQLGLARVALGARDLRLAQEHLARAEGAASESRVKGRLGILVGEIERVRGCVADVSAGRVAKSLSGKAICPL